jgi:hypothetical protein
VLGELGAFEEKGAELREFGDEIVGFAAVESGGVDFGGEKDGGSDIGAAFEAILFRPAWEFEQFSAAAADAALRNGKLFTALRTA